MKVLIIEDEYHAVSYLKKLLLKIEPETVFLGALDSVESAVEYFQTEGKPELVFMDIQLADGHSFDIFEEVDIDVPVIFTTAFDQYALKAFKMNSVDYLLKPIDEKELKLAVDKFHKFHEHPTSEGLKELIRSMSSSQAPSRQRFLVKQGRSWNYVLVKDLAYFYSADGITFGIDYNGKRCVLETTLDRLEKELNPDHFFRINRSQFVNLQAIQNINQWFNHRLKIELSPNPMSLESIVSRHKVKVFKSWLDR